MSRLTAALSGSRTNRRTGVTNLCARLDPRALLLSALAMLLAMAATAKSEVAGLLPFCAWPAVVLVLTRSSLGGLLRRLLPVLPFALMVGLLNPWLESRQVLLPGGVSISLGWFTLLSILLRALLCAATALLLFDALGIPGFCRGLAALKVPGLFVVQLQLLFRYFAVIGDELQRMHQAWQLRAASRRRLSMGLAIQLLQSLFLRAMERSGRIHNAMLARGFAGILPGAAPLHWRLQDTLWLLAWSGFALLCHTLNLPLLLGQLITGI